MLKKLFTYKRIRLFIPIFVGLLITASISFMFTKPTQVRADSLMSMNEGYGATINDSNGNVSGTITGATWKTEEYCKSGKCLYFDGDQDRVSFGDDADLDFAGDESFTITGWFRHPVISGNADYIIAKHQSGVAGGYKIYMDSDGDIVFAVDDDGTWDTADIAGGSANKNFDDNKWHHFAVVKLGDSDMAMYVDGDLIEIISLTEIGTLVNAAQMYIGVDADGTSNGWSGFLDEIKVYRSIRSAAEIKADFAGETPSRGTSASFGASQDFVSNGLVGYWKLDEASGNPTDYSGNDYTLTNNATTTFVSGKFGNGSEHVPASSQYFNLAGGTENDYYIDGSDAACADNETGFWSNLNNASDNNTTTYASTASSNQSATCEGSNAPTTGGTINSVEATFYGCIQDASGLNATLTAEVYLGGFVEQLSASAMQFGHSTPCTLSSVSETLATPSGGWTWQKANDLEVIYSAANDGDPVTSARAAELIVTVTSTGNGTISGVKSVSFWANPDSTTNYYISLTSSAYLTSSSGTLSATGFTNPKIFVNGVESNTIVADTWQLVTVTTETAIDADQFYVGRQGGNYYDGTLDEVRLYNRTLSPIEVAKLYAWAPGPILYLPLDENTGTSNVYDRSGNELTATLDGSMTNRAWVKGKFGSGLKFDGSNDRVRVTGDSIIPYANSPRTVEMWFYSYASTWVDEENTPFEYGAAGTDTVFGIDFWSNPTMEIQSWTDFTSFNSGLPAEGWAHLAVTYDGNGTVYAYINGVLKKTWAKGGSLNTTASADVHFGSGTAGAGYFDGILDELKMYNYARTASQIVEDMNGGHPSPGSPVGSATGYWKFDEGALNSCAGGTNDYCDNSVNANDLAFSTTSGGFSTSGKFSKAYNGADNVRATRDDDSDFDFENGSDEFTISAWFNRGGAISNQEYLVDKHASNDGFTLYMDNDGDIVCGIGDGTSFPEDTAGSTSANYDDTSWHHAVCVKQGTTSLKLYVDGTEISSNNTLGANGDMSNAGKLIIGDTNETDGTDEWLGDIDEIKIYRLAFTADQVKVEYNQGSVTNMGATSTDSSGNASWASDNEYCPPGGGASCTPPVAEWKMDENSGTTLFDSSGNGNVSTTWSGNTKHAPGNFGSSLYFDGADDVVQIAETATTDLGGASDSYTVSAWFKTSTAATDSKAIVAKIKDGAGGAFPFRLYYAGSPKIITFEIHDGSTTCASGAGGPIVNDGKWHFAAGVWDTVADFTYLYVDGVLVDFDSCGAISTFSNNDDISIGNGRDANPGPDYLNDDFDGFIDNVRIYNYIRTPEQIAWEYYQGAPIVHFKFDENTGSSVYDSMGVAAVQTITEATFVSGKRNYALDFDGSNDTIDMNDLTKLNVADGRDFTISGWFYRDTDNAIDPIVTKRPSLTNTEEGYLLYIDATTDMLTLEVADTDDDEYQLDSTSVFNSTTNTGWNHFVVTWDDDSTTNTEIYINGRPDNAVESSDTGHVLTDIGSMSNTRDFRIGSYHGGVEFYDGKIDDIMVFGYALNAEQAQLLYNEGATTRFGPSSGAP